MTTPDDLRAALVEFEAAEARYRLIFQTAPSVSHLDVGRAWDRMKKAGDKARAALAAAPAALLGMPVVVDTSVQAGTAIFKQGGKEVGRIENIAAAQAAEPTRPDIIERLTYHALERDDLTLDECLQVLADGYKRVRGRTDRQIVMQIASLLAAAPAAPAHHLPLPEKTEADKAKGREWVAGLRAEPAPDPVREKLAVIQARTIERAARLGLDEEAPAQPAEPVAHICILPTKDAGPTKFFTAPSDPRGFPVYTHPHPHPQPQTDSYVQPVPDKCDRITWRGMYYSLPPMARSQPLTDEQIDEAVAEWFAQHGASFRERMRAAIIAAQQEQPK
jgi:hypothetical protein